MIFCEIYVYMKFVIEAIIKCDNYRLKKYKKVCNFNKQRGDNSKIKLQIRGIFIFR